MQCIKVGSLRGEEKLVKKRKVPWRKRCVKRCVYSSTKRVRRIRIRQGPSPSPPTKKELGEGHIILAGRVRRIPERNQA